MNIITENCKIDKKLINQMFPDLENLLELHRNLLNQLINRYAQSSHKYITSVGDILLKIVAYFKISFQLFF